MAGCAKCQNGGSSHHHSSHDHKSRHKKDKKDKKKDDKKKKDRPTPPPPGETFRAELRGTSEVPPVQTTAFGRAEVRLSADETYLTYRVRVENVSTMVLGGNFHLGQAGRNGPIIKKLNAFGRRRDTFTSEGFWRFSDSEPLTSRLIQELKAGNIYVNVQTSGVPSGEVRGQLNLIVY